MVALDFELTPLNGDSRPLSEWLTTFPLVPVVLDPYTHESAWILDTARRVLTAYIGADCRPCWIVAASADAAKQFLGPYADEFLTFADPDGIAVKGFGFESAPAFALVRQDGNVVAKAEGWDPKSWRAVAEAIDTMTEWTRPQLPAEGDPAPFSGTSL